MLQIIDQKTASKDVKDFVALINSSNDKNFSKKQKEICDLKIKSFIKRGLIKFAE